MESETPGGLRVGITGGIGSGKSTVCRIFESLGIPVYDADYWAKWLLNHDPELKSGVKKVFGSAAYTSEGVYDRAFVAKAVFQDKEKLAALNALAHPAVEIHSKAWHKAESEKGNLYTLKEAALMIESGSYKHLDFLIVVTAPEAMRIQRVMERDGVSKEAVEARIRNQLPESDKMLLADAIIINDGQHSLVKQVWNLHQKLLKLAEK